MPTRYDFVTEWTGAPVDPHEHKRGIVRRRLRAKEAQWAHQSTVSLQASAERMRNNPRHHAYVDPEQELAPEYDLVVVRIL